MSTLKVDRLESNTGGNITFGSPIDPDGFSSNYRPGEIIEFLSHSCDGTTMTGVDRSYTWPNVTTHLDLTNSYQDLTGSVIAYTPPSAAKTVLYRFTWMFDDRGQGGISHYRFYIDDTEVIPAYTNLAYQYDTNQHGQNMAVFEYTIDCKAASEVASEAKFTEWTSNKTLKIIAREYSGSYQARAHFNTWRDGTGASAPFTFRRPVLSLTAIA